MVSYFLPALSTYAGDIDFIIDLIFWMVGAWFILSEVLLFWMIIRFRKKEGVKAEYISGELSEHKRWITIPHFLVLFCDIFILYYAIAAWYEVKQNLPSPVWCKYSAESLATLGYDRWALRARSFSYSMTPWCWPQRQVAVAI